MLGIMANRACVFDVLS